MTATSPLSQQILETDIVSRLREHSFNRSASHTAHNDAVASHHVVRAEFVDVLGDELSTSSQQELLNELREQGLLWSVVAEAIGVTDTAVRKWRKGQAIDVIHRRRLSRLVALSRLYADYALPTHQTAFAEWLDTRVVPGFSATPLALLKLNRDSQATSLQPLLDWMLQQPDGDRAESLLDRYLGPAWRQEAQDEQRFRIVTNAAGERILLIDG